MSAVILESTLTCPVCGHARTETMPTDACQWFYECGQCHTVLKPKPGDCCVYCSWGTVPCPPIQMQGKKAVIAAAIRRLLHRVFTRNSHCMIDVNYDGLHRIAHQI